MRTFSRAVRCGNTAEIWNERTSPSRATSAGRTPVMSRPLNTIRPTVGAMNLLSMLKQVVLPAPFGPIRAWIVPRWMRSETSLTARKSPKLLLRPSVTRMSSVLIATAGRPSACVSSAVTAAINR